jgi:VTC domain
MQKAEIYTLLRSFDPIGLNEMDEVKLMNRVETKYVFAAGRLRELLDLLSGSYKVLEVAGNRAFAYHTTYLDTSDLLFYTQHVRGKLSRHKVRYRRYESTGQSFLEIKKKNNKNRTIKKRIECFLTKDSPDDFASAFIKKNLPYISLALQPVLLNGFTRITLVGTEFKERITLDFDITFSSTEGRNSGLPFLAVAELKSDKRFNQSPFGRSMKKIGIRPNRFSKYCIGSVLTRNVPRINTLKPNLLLLNKIENEYSKSTGS